MNKDEIIKKTLDEMRGERGLLRRSEDQRDDDIDEYEDLVIATLLERLPEGDSQTCKDFKDIDVPCCESCHRGYAHYEMHLENLPGCGKAWVCCAVRGVLLRRAAASRASNPGLDITATHPARPDNTDKGQRE